jgi:hypothetical protein
MIRSRTALALAVALGVALAAAAAILLRSAPDDGGDGAAVSRAPAPTAREAPIAREWHARARSAEEPPPGVLARAARRPAATAARTAGASAEAGPACTDPGPSSCPPTDAVDTIEVDWRTAPAAKEGAR